MGAIQSRAVADFLMSAADSPMALVIEGEAGIGKTTLWLAGIARARASGFRVLSAQPAAAESVQAYASLADLLVEVESTVWAELPRLQRAAIDQVLLGTASSNQATDQRAVAAGFLSVVDRLADESPVLLAIDDLQWLDPSTARVVEFAARRLSGPVGVLGAERTDPGTGTTLSWLHLPRPDVMRRIQVPPLSLGELHAVLAERLGRTFPRPTMTRIHEISGGNPFYAMELARTLEPGATIAEAALPGTLAQLVRARIGGLATAEQEALLAAACAASPTVELIARATTADTVDVVSLLEGAEDSGVVEISGHAMRFAHPLLAQGVYANATPAQRRGMHRRLADIVEQPELQARHLALATTTFDAKALQSLDAAAEIAQCRGAPAAAAELLELAMGLGGDTPERRILLAGHHFDAGDLGRARTLLFEISESSAPRAIRAQALTMLALVRMMDDSFLETVDCLMRALADVGDDLALRVQILTTVSFVLFMVGDLPSALRNAEDALRCAERLGAPGFLSQALSLRAVLGAVRGEGIDEPLLQRALALEDHDVYSYIFVRPSFHEVLVLAWAGRLEQARAKMVAIQRSCVERGDETGLIIAGFNMVVGLVWLGDFASAAPIVEDAMDRARQAGGDGVLATALTMRAELAAYVGEPDRARRDVDEGLAASQRSGVGLIAGRLLMTLGFLEVSVGRYEEALAALESLIPLLLAAPDATEIFIAEFIPNAVEALTALGRLDEAEPLVAALERNGRRLDRAWMLAIGGRCRAMLLAARGDLAEANSVVLQAMSEHDLLQMPFERARTQLLVGQLQRRIRQKEAASLAFREALAAFEGLGTTSWAERARAELARVDVGPRPAGRLTPSEQRVAELAASGMTNRDVAAALFISPKTVESNLSRVYHKLGIRSRAELGRRLDQRTAGGET